MRSSGLSHKAMVRLSNRISGKTARYVRDIDCRVEVGDNVKKDWGQRKRAPEESPL